MRTLRLVGLVLAISGAARADVVTVAPFVDPPFADRCAVHEFAEGEAPALDGYPDDPLCVEYQKRDITATDGGAIRFLAAEPARFAIAIPKCRYWQQDHWSVQVAPDTTALVRWDGSYWFDKGTGVGAARLRNFQIGGQPAGPDDAANLIAPLDPDLAALIRQYGEGPNGGGGAVACLGFSVPSCATGDDVTRCGDNLGDMCAVAATRTSAQQQCDCASAPSHRQYVKCVDGVADAAVASGSLPPRCRNTVTRCAAHSTCGKPGSVTCCRTSSQGVTRCNIKRDAGFCRAPQRGAACVGTSTSCCDACTTTGCRP
jgi:hypothetical protein